MVTVNSPIDIAFDYIAPINLMHIFRGNAIIPGIIHTSVKEGWNKAGLQRTVYFADGSTSQESLLTVNAPTSFSYGNEHFTYKVLSALIKRLEGEWLFTDLGNNKTRTEWAYRVIPNNRLAKIIIRLVFCKSTARYAERCAGTIKRDLETGQLEAGTT